MFTREDLKLREQRQLDLLTERLQRDLASLSLQQAQSGDSGAEQAMSAGQQLLSELKSTQAVGPARHQPRRRPESEPGAPTRASSCAAATRSTSRALAQEVTVLGEVQNSTSHLYREGLDAG